ncbi:MAG: Na+:solute symporter [Sedimentisphaerales bacterium]|nr:Na+:solute symporter [Sedimentisphaerales bacterium]
MTLAGIDWAVIGLYFVVSLAIGLAVARRAGGSTGDFFLSGRALPWWIAGTSMVATTFAADTPLAVTELVAQNGIAGNWLWWNMLLGGTLAAFFFARLWRRAGILTDCEFVSIRYSGTPAAFLRGFRAIYIGVLMNLIVIGWVNLAMVKILAVVFPEMTLFGVEPVGFLGFTFTAHLLVVGLLMLLVAGYSALSGLWGVSITDAFQFTIAMIGCIVLAVLALRDPQVGGIAGLQEKLPEWVFRFTPAIGSTEPAGETTAGLLQISVLAFVTYLAVQWWASWYPGAEPGGGGYIAQRMMSAKNEKHALLASLWFNVAHYAIRPWPWVIVALCSLVLYPELAASEKGQGFMMTAGKVLPAGLLGLLLAAFLAAYMSTISTQLNWGCSYIINDFYRPFVRPGAPEKHYVTISRIATFAIMVLSLFVTSKLERISDAWKFMLECSGGIGLVLILRWFWWRINAWSEIAALLAPFAIYPILKLRFGVAFPQSLLIIVAWSTVVWLAATFATRPTEESVLLAFYRRVHPGGVLWRPIAAKLPDVSSDTGYAWLFVDWVAGSLCVTFSLLGVGKLIFGRTATGLLLLAAALVLGISVALHLSRICWRDSER